jgi:hypothetical protein
VGGCHQHTPESATAAHTPASGRQRFCQVRKLQQLQPPVHAHSHFIWDAYLTVGDRWGGWWVHGRGGPEGDCHAAVLAMCCY